MAWRQRNGGIINMAAMKASIGSMASSMAAAAAANENSA